MNRLPMGLATAKRGPVMPLSQQLLLYVGIGVILPTLMWTVLRGIPLSDGIGLITLIQVVISNLGCLYIIGKLRKYARARLLSYVLPVGLGVFGTIFAVNNLLRAEFSHSLFLSGFVATLATSYLVTARIRHANPNLHHFVIPGGETGRLAGARGFAEISSTGQLETLIDQGEVSGSIVADLHHQHAPEWERLLAKAALKGIPVYHYRLIEEALTGEVRINHLRENDLGSLIPNLPYMSAKRAFDIVSVLLLSPFLILLGCLLAIAIRIDSKGPVFFFQERVGFRGEIFRMAKFRTMRPVAPAAVKNDARQQAMTQDNDARITRIGRTLRKTRLDEVPQAWNVLVGDMSWIGPRPEAEALAEWYEKEIPFYSYRHIVRPGITGWAQVNQGHVTDLDSIQGKLRLDFYYVKNLSLWLDALIALKTIRVIFGGIGAK